ncbi:MAG TPA: GAF domain-containing protein, partial [Chroococcidiopsis sp.]
MARILVVGDELAVAVGIQRDLEASKHCVVGCLALEPDVIAAILQMQPDLVVVDSGLGAEPDQSMRLQRFRLAIASPTMLFPMVFLIDGASPLPVAIASVVEGAVVLPKPWGVAQLLSAIETALASAEPVVRDRLPDLDPAQAPEYLQHQADHYRIVGAIAQRIRQSLDLDKILNTTALEVRQLLQVDRVIVYRFEPDWSGYVITESVEAPWPVMLGRNITDPCLSQEQCIIPYMQGHIASHGDIYTAGLAECYTSLLGQFAVRANLVIPVMAGAQLWGLLAAQHCQSPRHWLEWEIDLLRQLSSQISIAIQQSQMYQHTHLQAQRQQILNCILQTIRHSLDLPTIFQAVVNDVGVQMQMEHVQITQYLPEREVWVVRGAYSQAPHQFPADTTLEIADRGNLIAAQLKLGNTVQLADASLATDPVNQELAQTFPGAWLIVPLQMGDSVWGSLGLLRYPAPYVWPEWQVELVRAIADQLAIAIQQAELYRQVQRLNSDLESQVQIRTTQLRRALSFEAVLKHIADQVHDSLDENRILQAVVEGLANVLGVDSCLTAVYDPGAASYSV